MTKTVIKSVLLLLVIVNITVAFEAPCCVNDTQFDHESNKCIDNRTGIHHQLTIKCPMYMLDPELDPNDEFHIIGDGSLIINGGRFEEDQ